MYVYEGPVYARVFAVVAVGPELMPACLIEKIAAVRGYNPILDMRAMA